MPKDNFLMNCGVGEDASGYSFGSLSDSCRGAWMTNGGNEVVVVVVVVTTVV